MALLEVEDLAVTFTDHHGSRRVVDGLGYRLDAGGSLAIVGESGSGKTQSALALVGLCGRTARVTGSVRLEGRELLGLPWRALQQIRGERIAMVFQDPMASLNPYRRIGGQMTEVLTLRGGLSATAARAESLRMLDAVQVGDATRRFSQYPHELSGGLRQRVMIAIALLGRPDVLIADEPTTALDVTVQAQILRLLAELRADLGMATLLITHDLGLVAGLCQEILVMYAGRPVEQGPVDAVFDRPAHPYTQGLLYSVPRLGSDRGGPPDRHLRAIPGSPPPAGGAGPACAFAPRCPRRIERCAGEQPEFARAAGGRRVACHLEEPL
jgi:oligopeptide transport system ATP-binding protein